MRSSLPERGLPRVGGVGYRIAYHPGQRSGPRGERQDPGAARCSEEMSMRRFELIEGTSSKFWEVDLEGSSVTVRFGRIGTQGQTQTKTFSDAPAAKKEHDKLVKDKTGKGYGEVGVAAVHGAAGSTGGRRRRPRDASPCTRCPACSPGSAAAIACRSPGCHRRDDRVAAGRLRMGRRAAPATCPSCAACCAPRAVDGHVLLKTLLVLEDDRYGYVAPALAELGQKLGKTWTPWGSQGSRSMITRAHLTRGDVDRLDRTAGADHLRTQRSRGSALGAYACMRGRPLDHAGRPRAARACRSCWRWRLTCCAPAMP
jgi:predicted DNA-binding WGR domain protein